MTAHEIAYALDGNAKKVGEDYVCRCALASEHEHGDRTPSFHLGDADGGKILAKCWSRHANEQDRIVDALRSRGLWPEPTKAHTNGASPNGTKEPGVTLEEFAKAKGLPVEFLRSMGVEQRGPVVIFHYRSMTGQRAKRHKIRKALNKSADEDRFIYTKGEGKPVPYGLWLLDDARKRGERDLVLPEGESDALTFSLHGINALGIPGSEHVRHPASISPRGIPAHLHLPRRR
jgi:hypothetical protein